MFLQRPPSHRNAVWEADHVEAPVQVEADGRLVKPWVTWFVDAAHDVILGVAVTPRTPNRESVLAALRAAVMRREPYGPAGGLPAAVRIDRGKDFLSHTVADALGAFAVRVDDLPAYGAHLKGTVETINGAAEKMLFAGLPRYTHRQTHVSGAPVDPDQPPLSFEMFTAEVLGWVRWWNTEHTLTERGERTPMQSWDDDPTPIHDADETRLWMFTLEDDRRRRTITTKGVAFGRGRHYVADWMVGLVGPGCGSGTCRTTPGRSRCSTPIPGRIWAPRYSPMQPLRRTVPGCCRPAPARRADCGRIWPRPSGSGGSGMRHRRCRNRRSDSMR